MIDKISIKSMIVLCFISLYYIPLITLAEEVSEDNPSQRIENGSKDNTTQKIVKVCTLNSVEANQEFQRNVQLLRMQRQQIVELKAQVDQTKDQEKRADLETNIDDLLKKLDENNEVMFKTYGFSLNRNYTMVIETSHIYMMVTDDEAKRFEDEEPGRVATEELDD